MKKLLLGSLATSMMLPLSTISAFAADQNVGVGTTEVPITADLTSGFTVTIPKALDISTGTANYAVGIIGDIASDEKITVVPDSNFNLADVNTKKANLSTTVTQTKQEWDWNEIKTQVTANGSMAVTGLTAGDWTGKANFNVNINQKIGESNMLIDGPNFNTVIPDNATTVSFISTKAPAGVTLTDVSTVKDNGVVTWMEGADMFVSTQKPGIKVYGNNSCSNMFGDKFNLTAINFDNFDTRNVTDMGGMFRNCGSLISLDLSEFDTHNVTETGYMFETCRKLSSLNLTNFNTSKVKNMYSMFCACESLTSLDLSNFDTSSAKCIDTMFWGAKNLTATLTIKNKDTILHQENASVFFHCSCISPAKFTLNYTAETENIVDALISGKNDSNANIVKGHLV